jgi:hypothetical protein
MSLQGQIENYVRTELRVPRCCGYLVIGINTTPITDTTLMVVVLHYMKVPWQIAMFCHYRGADKSFSPTSFPIYFFMVRIFLLMLVLLYIVLIFLQLC